MFGIHRINVFTSTVYARTFTASHQKVQKIFDLEDLLIDKNFRPKTPDNKKCPLNKITFCSTEELADDLSDLWPKLRANFYTQPFVQIAEHVAQDKKNYTLRFLCVDMNVSPRNEMFGMGNFLAELNLIITHAELSMIPSTIAHEITHLGILNCYYTMQPYRVADKSLCKEAAKEIIAKKDEPRFNPKELDSLALHRYDESQHTIELIPHLIDFLFCNGKPGALWLKQHRPKSWQFLNEKVMPEIQKHVQGL